MWPLELMERKQFVWYSLKYTDDMKDWQGGCARFWFIKIRPKYKDDVGLLEHEKVHVRQFWRLPFIHGIRYKFSEKYRLRCEVEAYREQLRWYPDTYTDWYRSCYAKSITEKYNLDIKIDKAIGLLR